MSKKLRNKNKIQRKSQGHKDMLLLLLCVGILLAALPVSVWAVSGGSGELAPAQTVSPTAATGEASSETTGETVSETVGEIAEDSVLGMNDPAAPAPVTIPATTNTVPVSNKDDFPSNGILEDNTTYKLSGNVLNCQPLYVKPGYTVVIDLNNRMLQCIGGDAAITVQTENEQTDAEGNVISASNPGKLYVINSKELTRNTVSGYLDENGVWKLGGDKSHVLYVAFINNIDGIGILSSGYVYVENCSIIGCQSEEMRTGAAVCGTSTAQIELYNVEVCYNRTIRTFVWNAEENDFTGSLGWGGVVHSEREYSGSGSWLKATDCNIHHNSSASKGGGISGGHITLDNCTVTDNKAYRGGGVCAIQSLTINGGSVSNNKAEDAGGGIVMESGSTGLNISNCTISNNQLTGTHNAESLTQIVGQGGGIAIYNTATNHQITSCTFESNHATYRGGAIYVSYSQSNLTISGGTIKDNTAVDNGGGIYSEGSTTVTGGVDIDYNSAGSNGGGIYTTYTATLISGTIQNNSAGGNGGGVYACYVVVPAEASNLSILTNNATGNGGGFGATRWFEINGPCTIQGNTAGGAGGGVFRLNQQTNHQNVIGGGCVITGNKAVNGGGAYIGWHNCIVSGNAQIKGNTATGSGGGIYVNAASSSATDSTGVNDDPNARGTVIVSNASITGNGAVNGGGIYGTANSTITLNAGADVSDNTATSFGGGIYGTINSKVTVAAAQISGNEAGENGGGIYTTGSGVTITVSDGAKITGNEASKDGGGIAAAGSDSGAVTNVAVTDSQITGNIASGYGGGIYAVTNLEITVTDSEVSTNSGTTGGGIFLGANCAVTVSGTTLSENTATTANGGGIYTGSGATIVIKDQTEFRKNTAVNGYGGGIYQNNAADSTFRSFTVTDSGFVDNSAKRGGGIYLHNAVNTAALTVTGSAFSENSASIDGGAIYSQGAVTIDATAVEDNLAAVKGGGIYVGSGKTLTVQNGSTVSRNKTTTDTGAVTEGTDEPNGGGIFSVGGADVIINNSTVSGNESTYRGGGIFQGVTSGEYGVILTNGAVVENNRAAVIGGGVYGYKLTMEADTSLVGNSATQSQGGGFYVQHLVATGTQATPVVILENKGGTNGGGGCVTQSANITYAQIRDNIANGFAGGGLCLLTGSESTVSNTTISGNIAGYGTEGNSRGGGLYLEGTATVTGCTITGNRAGWYGGGIHTANGSELTVADTYITYNDAIQMSAELTTSSVGRGGGVSVMGTAFFTDTFISNNRALRYGGGIHIGSGEPSDNETGTVIWNSGSITYNNTIMHGAGGVHVSIGNFTLVDGEISHNTAVEVGGGLHAINSIVTIQGGKITDNTVTAGRGGGIHIDQDGRVKDLRKLSITGGEISGNIAKTGKRVTGITMESILPGAAFTATYASSDTMGDGGGLYIAGTACTITGGEIKNNTAENNGGGIAVGDLLYQGVNYEGSLDMISGVLTENTAGNLGGGIYIIDANVTVGVDGCDGTTDKHIVTYTDLAHPVVENNTAGDCGGGIAMEGDNATCDIFCCDITNNQLSTNRGRGYNVYVTGGALNLVSSNLGGASEPELVIVGGSLKRGTADADIALYYYKNNSTEAADKTAFATEGEYFHLPDAKKYWTGEGIFMGWTFRGPADEDPRNYVRDTDGYYPIGKPFQAIDSVDGSAGDSAVHMYALWVPETSGITYSGAVIDGVFQTQTLSTDDSNPDSYTFTADENPVTLGEPARAGYTFEGWYLYQDEDQNANWGYEPAYSNGVLDPENLHYFSKTTALDLGSSRFGNITLVPKYTENTVTYTYYTVGPEGVDNFGTISQDGSIVASGYAYEIKTASGTPKTVTAEAAHRYKFLGWYADEACTQLVSEDAAFTVTQTDGLYTGGSFFAKFDYYLEDLTIHCAATGYFSGEQSFLYEVWCEGVLVTTVTLNNGESVTVRDLFIDKTYTVKQIESWSWRFLSGIAEATQSRTLIVGDNEVSFTSDQQRHLWLTHDTRSRFGSSGNG